MKQLMLTALVVTGAITMTGCGGGDSSSSSSGQSQSTGTTGGNAPATGSQTNTGSPQGNDTSTEPPAANTETEDQGSTGETSNNAGSKNGFTQTRWKENLEVEAGSGAADAPNVTITGNGTALAIWHQFNGTTYDIRTARMRIDENSWEDLGVLYNAPYAIAQAEHTVNTPRSPGIGIASNNAGNVIATWSYDNASDLDSSSKGIWVAHYGRTADVWDSPYLLHANCLSGQYASVGINDNGDAVAAWVCQGEMGGNNQIYASVFDGVQRAWSTPVAVSSRDHTLSYTILTSNTTPPQVAIGNDGKPWIIYVASTTGSEDNVYAATTNNFGSWDTSEVDKGDGDVETAKVTTTKTGISVAWAQNETGLGYSVFSRNWSKSQNDWHSPIRIESHAGDAYGVDICANEKEDVFVTWAHRSDSNESQYSRALYGAKFTPYNGWEKEKLVWDLGSDAAQIECDRFGNAEIVFSGVHVYTAHYYSGFGWGSFSHVSPHNGGQIHEFDANDSGQSIAIWRKEVDGVDSIFATRRK